MQNYQTFFEYKEIGDNQISILDNDEIIAEIKNVALINAKFRPQGEIIIGSEYPLPLYWQQYSNHEDPERNAGLLVSMTIDCKPESITINLQSQNGSGSITSHYGLKLSYDSLLEGYIYSIDAKLIINSEWIITYNPTHGEVEYLNIYPANTFVKQRELKKKYDCFMYESANNLNISIPHYHFDLDAYRNIKLIDNGKFYYLMENENPVVQLTGATAGITDIGVCSYMWDTHFGIRICSKEENNIKLKKNIYNASFRLYSILRDSAVHLLNNSTQAEISDIANIPILHEGVNTFDKSLLEFNDKRKYWPFQTETVPKSETRGRDPISDYFVDRTTGFSDTNSLAIKTTDDCISRWIYTSLGPEFGGEELPKGKQIKVSCMGKIPGSIDGESIRISIRIRKNMPDNTNKFILFSSTDVKGKSDWVQLTCMTPKLDFEFDRIHFLLEHSGIGECRFDDFEYEIIND